MCPWQLQSRLQLFDNACCSFFGLLSYHGLIVLISSTRLAGKTIYK